ncbi:putative lipid II flippase FtsW [Angustibacter aerolatus]
MSAAAHDGAVPVGGSRLRRHLPVLERLESPVTTYYLLLGATLCLLVIGLVMVLSASSVTSLTKTGSSFTTFKSQAVFAALGVPLMLVASRLSLRTWQRLGWGMVVATVVAQALVFSPLGVEVNGNRNWIELAGQRLQPSEGLKLALVVWGATVLCRKRALLDRASHVVVPLLFPVGALALGLVLLGHDLGTTLILLMVLAALLFAAGAPARMFVTAGLASAALVAVFVVTSENRMARLGTWLHCTDSLGACMQPIHGKYALADGGFWGVGLGASREKWSWLPEAHNDFIFAIIGEELGLPGTLVVLALFLALGYACFRMVTRTSDLFVRIATAAAMAWLLGQMLVNVGAVIGMLPVIGVPLPLVSSGGSALIVTLVLLGMLMSFARHEPGCRDVLAARPGLVRRGLAVVPGARRRVAGRTARSGRTVAS